MLQPLSADPSPHCVHALEEEPYLPRFAGRPVVKMPDPAVEAMLLLGEQNQNNNKKQMHNKGTEPGSHTWGIGFRGEGPNSGNALSEALELASSHRGATRRSGDNMRGRSFSRPLQSLVLTPLAQYWHNPSEVGEIWEGEVQS